MESEMWQSYIRRVVEEIELFTEEVSLSKCTPPFLENTFSLWRKLKYSQMLAEFDRTRLSFDARKIVTLRFIEAVDDRLLSKFSERIRNEMHNRLSDERIKYRDGLSIKDFKLNADLLYSYNFEITNLMVTIELLSDFIKRPYSPMAEQNCEVKNLLRRQNTDSFLQIIKKKVTEKLFALAEGLSKSMLTKVGIFSIVSGGNLFILLGGLLVSKSFQMLAGLVKEIEVSKKIKEELPNIRHLNTQLTSNYEAVCSLTKRYVEEWSANPLTQLKVKARFSDEVQKVVGKALCEASEGVEGEHSLFQERKRGDWLEITYKEINLTEVEFGWSLVDIVEESAPESTFNN